MKVVVASLNPSIERLMVVSRHEPGRVHTLLKSETLAGGKGVNVARVLRQLAVDPFVQDASAYAPLEPVLVGPLGGPTGALQATLLEEEGLNAVTVATRRATRVSEVLVDESDPRGATVYNARGPEILPDEERMLSRVALESLADAAFLVCAGSLPPGLDVDFYGTWITEATLRGIPSLLDARGDALRQGAAAAPTVVKVNRDELAELAADTGACADDLVASWRASGVYAVIVTDGAEPAVLHTEAGTFEIVPPNVETVSSVGSGDAFTAGLVWSAVQHPGRDWPDHVVLAAACGASNATSQTARLARDLPPEALLGLVQIRRR